MTDRIENPHQAALVIIDVMNDFDFDAADELLAEMTPTIPVIAELRDQASALDVPVIYVNDNFGLWRSEKAAIIDHCRTTAGGRWKIVEPLVPRPDDYFVVKPRHSGFFASNLPVLLPDLRARRLVLTGVAADICVLFTANDAYMRDYTLWIPSNGVASASRDRSVRALDHMATILKADTRPSSAGALETWLTAAPVSERFVD